MKRMNVREFRKNVSHLSNEPIEVVRYSETIGFWVPQEMTLEPRVRSGPPPRPVKRPMRKLSEAEREFEDIIEAIKRGRTLPR
jgi:hypothetical protein